MSPSDYLPEPRPGRKGIARFRIGRRCLGALGALAGAFAIGAGLTAVALPGRQTTMVALTPAPITAMPDWSPVAVKGRVSEIFGNKFIIEDESGRALVETGREGEGGGLVAKSETVTVQGRFERGFIQAMAISHANGRSDVVGPQGPPRRGPWSVRGMEDGLNRLFARHSFRPG